MIKNKSQIYVDHEMKSMGSLVRDLNSRPLVYKTSALTTELTRLTQFFLLNLYNFWTEIYSASDNAIAPIWMVTLSDFIHRLKS